MNKRVSGGSGITFFGFVLSLLSPVVVLVSTLISRGSENKRFILFLLVILYGTTIPLSVESDGFRHQQMVYEEYIDMSWSRFVDDAKRILTFRISSSSSDLYKHVVSFLTGSVLGAPGLFFFVISFVYAYFFSGAMVRVFRDFRSSNKGFIFWVFVILFLFTKNVEGIQTVRTWTGLWILFYGAMKYYDSGDKKYILVMLLPPLVHFGYFVMAVPAYFVVFFGNRHQLYGILFVVSSVTNLVQPNFVSPTISQYELGEQKMNEYFMERKLDPDEKLNELNKAETSRTWYKKLYQSGYFKWPTNLLIYVFLFFGVYPRLMNRLEKSLFSIGLLTLTASNALFFIFAASNRMSIIGLVFILGSFVLFMQRGNVFQTLLLNTPLFRFLVTVSAVFVLPKFVYHISFFLSQFSFYLFFAPFIPWVEPEANLSTLDVIKNILSTLGRT